MPFMNDQHIARFEAQLERLVEGAFAAFFGKRIRAQDIALQVARAMEDGAQRQPGVDSRPLAPDQYTITMHGRAHAHLLRSQPNITHLLGQHIIELATNSGFRLVNQPAVIMLANNDLDHGKVIVNASHSSSQRSSTAVMQPVNEISSHSTPHNPQLLINGQQVIPLTKAIVTIGRVRTNDIILDDPFTSRHHAQLRLRFGVYTVFDTNSTSGTFVNEVQVMEHRLQPGDVIRIGQTQIIYLEDERSDEAHSLGQTDMLPPYHPPESA